MKVYAVRYKDEENRAQSQSGGAFAIISEQFLKDGVVYGCALDEDFKAIHIRTDNKTDLDRLRRSKYVQSSIGDCYKQVKQDLINGKKVLFSGMSCQVAGLKKFLQQDYENLLCVDIVCHGVPSPAVWDKYLQWRKDKINKKIIDVNFRNKNKFGWHSHVETLTLDDGSQIDSIVYVNMTFIHNILRPSCYECPYKSVDHPGDITIADYWGLEKAAPELNDNKGTSIVLVNDEKGQCYFNSAINENVICKETRIEDSMQPPFIAPFSDRTYEKEFWDDFRTKEFSYMVRKWGGLTFKFKVKQFIKKLLGKTYLNG